MTTVQTKEELIAAVKRNEPVIIVIGELAPHIKKTKMLGKVAWLIFSTAITAAVSAIVTGKIALVTAAATSVPTAGAGAAVGGGAAALSFTGAGAMVAGATTIVGLPTAITIVSIAVVSGGFGLISTIRNKYSLEQCDGGKIVLKRK